MQTKIPHRNITGPGNQIVNPKELALGYKDAGIITEPSHYGGVINMKVNMTCSLIESSKGSQSQKSKPVQRNLKIIENEARRNEGLPNAASIQQE